MSLNIEAIQSEGWASEAEIDGTVIKNALLCGNESKNGYKIPSTAFGDEENVKRLYENKLIFINHLDQPTVKKVRTRPLEDLGGYIRNVRFIDGKPRGDIHTEGTPKGHITLELAKNRVPNVGLSHVGDYKLNQNKPLGLYVETVKEVYTVDVVTHPATTKSFYEQTQEKDMSEVLEREIATVRQEKDEIKTKYDQLVISAESEKGKLQELQTKFDQLKQENDQLKLKVDEFETAKALNDRKLEIESELKAEGLEVSDEAQVSKLFLETLHNEKDSEKRKALIKERAELVKRVKTEGTVHGSSERQAPTPESFDISKTINTIKFI